MLHWVALKKVDNWGTISYTWNDITFKKPSHAIVRWPSGRHERCKVISRDRSGTIIDMGVRHSVCIREWFVKTDHHGLMVEVPIEKVSVAVERKKIVTEMAGV